jgi:hypothetical protein
MKICSQACYQGQAYSAFTGFRILHYETWLFRLLGSKIYFKGHFGHEGVPKIKIKGPKEQDSNKTEPIKSRTKNLQTKHQNKSQ